MADRGSEPVLETLPSPEQGGQVRSKRPVWCDHVSMTGQHRTPKSVPGGQGLAGALLHKRQMDTEHGRHTAHRLTTRKTHSIQTQNKADTHIHNTEDTRHMDTEHGRHGTYNMEDTAHGHRTRKTHGTRTHNTEHMAHALTTWNT